MKQITLDCIKFFEKGMTVVELASHFNVTPSSIHRFLRKHNLGVGKKKYFYNENYFDNIDSEDKAYFLGFLYADGNITNTKRKYSIRLEIHNKDIDILKKFKYYLNYDKPIYLYKREICGLEIIGKTILDSVGKYGLLPRKTFNLKFPNNLNNDMLQHFVRGFFDGDGGLSLLEDKRISHKVAKLSFTSTPEFCESIRQILKDKCNANSKFCVRHPDRNTIGSLTSGGNLQVQRILDYLYNNATIFLNRKYELYKELCQINL